MAMTIFMLQTFTIQCCTTGCTAQQKSARAHITCGPSQITNALQTKHRIENIERNHDAIIRRVRRSCSDPRTHRACFVDTFLKDLSGLIFAVVANLIFIYWLIQLALLIENTDLTEKAFHTKGTCFINQNRYYARS